MIPSTSGVKTTGKCFGFLARTDVYSHVLPTMQEAATDKLEMLLYRKFGAF
jgi:hypothetical protein